MSHFTKSRSISRKPLGRSQMIAVLHRLRAELDVLVESAPSPAGMLRKGEINVEWRNIETHVRELWGHV